MVAVICALVCERGARWEKEREKMGKRSEVMPESGGEN